MIQRIQSVWLLLAGFAGLLTYKLPLWKSVVSDGTEKKFMGPQSLLLFVIIVGSSLLAWAAIFLYKNRKLQKQLCWLGVFLSLVIIVLEYLLVVDFKQSLNLTESSWQIGAILPVLMVILFIMAISGIRKDEKLIKSLDRLR
jgi:peptidoglycan/LPS O-acetylase OafA/YrhL